MDAGSAVERRIERVVLETDRHLVVGDVTLPPEGYMSRFSDLLNNTETDFVALVDVEISPLEGGEIEKHPFLALGKAHVRVAHPLAESA